MAGTEADLPGRERLELQGLVRFESKQNPYAISGGTGRFFGARRVAVGRNIGNGSLSSVTVKLT